jgi:hypothetical protein
MTAAASWSRNLLRLFSNMVGPPSDIVSSLFQATSSFVTGRNPGGHPGTHLASPGAAPIGFPPSGFPADGESLSKINAAAGCGGPSIFRNEVKTH